MSSNNGAAGMEISKSVADRILLGKTGVEANGGGVEVAARKWRISANAVDVASRSCHYVYLEARSLAFERRLKPGGLRFWRQATPLAASDDQVYVRVIQWFG